MFIDKILSEFSKVIMQNYDRSDFPVKNQAGYPRNLWIQVWLNSSVNEWKILGALP